MFSFRRDRASADIYNGVHTVRMRLNFPIPPTIFIAGEPIRIWYPMQPKMCRRCGDINHVAAKCSSMRFYNCEAPGHRANVSTMPALCSICLGEGHKVTACPFYLFSANVVVQPGDSAETVPQPAKLSSYAGVASRSPEQAEAIKAARAARSTSEQPTKQPSAGSEPPTDSRSKSSSTKRSSETPSKNAPSDDQSRSPSVGRVSERRSERDCEHSRERTAGRDRDRHRDCPRDRDHSREDDRDRSSRRDHHHHGSADSDDSDYGFVQVRHKRRSRR